MVRTQIYLTRKEREQLALLAGKTGKKQSELIREAVDKLLEHAGKHEKRAALDEAAGMWKDRTDLPDFRSLRNSWDRG